MTKFPIFLTGEEQDYFDFLPCIRASIRIAHMYNMRREVEKYVWDSHYWQNPDWIRNRLATYFIIQLKDTPSKKRKKRVLSEAHKEALQRGRDAHRENGKLNQIDR